jgi:hypothetical protein
MASKGRPKAAVQVEIKPWLSAKRDSKEGRFIQVGNTLLLSKKFHKLSTGARQMYLCMAMESGGRRNFNFSKGTGTKYGFPYTSHTRFIKELIESRFIICTKRFHTIKNEYEFSFLEWKADTEPTDKQ